jgi:hypothetical protein
LHFGLTFVLASLIENTRIVFGWALSGSWWGVRARCLPWLPSAKMRPLIHIFAIVHTMTPVILCVLHRELDS